MSDTVKRLEEIEGWLNTGSGGARRATVEQTRWLLSLARAGVGLAENGGHALKEALLPYADEKVPIPLVLLNFGDALAAFRAAEGLK